MPLHMQIHALLPVESLMSINLAVAHAIKPPVMLVKAVSASQVHRALNNMQFNFKSLDLMALCIMM